MGMSNYVMEQQDNHAEAVIAFMASVHGVQVDALTEEQELAYLQEFDACEEYQRDFRIFA